MENSGKILVNKEVIEKVNLKLKSLRLMTLEKETKNAIDEVLNILYEECENNKASFKEILQDKIRETKHSNEELNFKLYMLLRKLEDERISEEEAAKTYELYINGHIEDI